jgi:ribosome-associated toxin RatA of RatAB toxin-antitoxin module
VIALVVLLLAFRKADFKFGPPLFPIKFERHDGEAFAFHGADHVIELTPVEKQLTRTRRVRIHVGGCRSEGSDVGAEDEGLAILEIDVSLGNLCLARTHALDLPTEQGNSGLEALFDEVIEARLTVDGDGRQFFGVFHGGWKSTDSAVAAPAHLPENPRMQTVERSALVTFKPAQMFALVNDIGRYPEFLPWCVAARVSDESPTERLATLKVARGVLQTEFTTRNTLLPDTKINMQLTHGPFRDLVGEWRFEAIGDRGSRVHFRVEFEFKNRLTATAFNAVFESMCGTIVEAFAQRAQKIYA